MRNHVLGIAHVMIGVSDIDRSIDFYQRFGFEVAMRIPISGAAFEKGSGIAGAQVEMALLSRPQFTLELLQAVPPEAVDVSDQSPWAVGGHHICLDVDDLPGLYSQLRSEGIRFRGEPAEIEGHPIRFVYMLDPDGITVELMERLGVPPV